MMESMKFRNLIHSWIMVVGILVILEKFIVGVKSTIKKIKE